MPHLADICVVRHMLKDTISTHCMMVATPLVMKIFATLISKKIHGTHKKLVLKNARRHLSYTFHISHRTHALFQVGYIFGLFKILHSSSPYVSLLSLKKIHELQIHGESDLKENTWSTLGYTLS